MTDDNSELKKTIRDEFEDKLENQVQRLQFILSLNSEINFDSHVYFSSPALAYWYYQEAIDCFYYGNYIATIILSQVALEERLRHFFRISGYKITTSKGKMKNSDEATFLELIDEASSNKLISPTERDLLHHLRKDLRNLYTHSKDRDLEFQTKLDGKNEIKSLPHHELMRMKIKTDIIIPNTKSDAEDALKILIEVYNSISLRSPMA